MNVSKKWKQTKTERKVLKHLVKAWNAWVELKHEHPAAVPEFQQALHTCEYLVGMRQIARVDKTWSSR